MKTIDFKLTSEASGNSLFYNLLHKRYSEYPVDLNKIDKKKLFNDIHYGINNLNILEIKISFDFENIIYNKYSYFNKKNYFDYYYFFSFNDDQIKILQNNYFNDLKIANTVYNLCNSPGKINKIFKNLKKQIELETVFL